MKKLEGGILLGDETTKFESATLYFGNQLVSKAVESGKMMLVEEIKKKNYLLSLKFVGYFKFSLIIRPNGKFRISCGKPEDIDAGLIGNLEEETSNFIFAVFAMIREFVGISILDNSKYKILMLNGIYKKVHNLSCGQSDYEKIKNSGEFPVVKEANFGGMKRRKGSIKMYMQRDQKHGMIMVNKVSYQLMGFVAMDAVKKAIEKLNRLTV
jgi:hypothetical protein